MYDPAMTLGKGIRYMDTYKTDLSCAVSQWFLRCKRILDIPKPSVKTDHPIETNCRTLTEREMGP